MLHCLDIPQYFLPIYQLMNMKVFFIFLSSINNTAMNIHIFVFSLLLNMYQVIELLKHMVNLFDSLAFLVVQMVKCLPAMHETRVRFLGWEDPLEKEMATRSSTLAWKIPWMKEPGRLQPMGSKRVGHDWATSHLIHWKDWCWSWSSNTLATWWEELTHWKRPWWWERLKAGREREDRGWDDWMASLIQWTWVWASSGIWWWTGKPGVLQSMGSQRVRHDWVTELKWW